MVKISVVLPAWNERGNIVRLSGLLLSVPGVAELIVVDDASSDGTPEAWAGAPVSADPRVRFVRNEERAGLARSVAQGIGLATMTYVLVRDSDWNHDVGDTAAFVEAAGRGADLVIATRYGRSPSPMRRGNDYLSRALNGALAATMGFTTDWTYGYFLVRRELMSRMPLGAIFRGRGEYAIRLFGWLRSECPGLQVTEIATRVQPRGEGRSGTRSFRHGKDYLFALAGMVAKRAPARVFAVLSVGAFLWFYRRTFSVGFADEDFAWLSRLQGADLIGYLTPTAGSPYRPAAANIPYFLFSSSVLGVLAWKALTLALVARASTAFRRCRAGSSTLAAALGALWLLAPFQSFPAFYLNAFDYAIYPAATIGLLVALQRERFGIALAIGAVAVFSKEQALGLIAAPWVIRARRPPRCFLAGGFSLAAAALLLHGGLSASGGRAAGFAVSFQGTELIRNTGRVFSSIYFGSRLGGWGLAWHLLAWAVMFEVLAELSFARAWAGLRCAARYIGFTVVLTIPLLFLPQIRADHLGAVPWALAFLGLADASRNLSGAARRRSAVLSAICALAAIPIAGVEIPAKEAFVRKRVDLYAQALAKAESFLAGCTPADQVVLEGLVPATGDPNLARYLASAMRWRFPYPKFFLLRDAASPDVELPGDSLMWVEAWRTHGHPRLRFTTDSRGGWEILGEGDPGCGLPDPKGS